MKILSIDTSTKYLGVAVAVGSDVVASLHDKGALQHSSRLIPSIDKVLKNADLELKDIDAIALGIGPGSFTGLRIGVATCKGINMALGIPIVAVPTLDVIAYNFINTKEKILCPTIDAKKEKLYACLYEVRNTTLKRLTDYMLTDIDGLLDKIDKPTLLFGDGIELYGERAKKNPFVHISEKEWLPKAEIVVKLALAKAKRKEFANPDKLVPMYLHSQYCQIRGKA